MAVRLDTAWVRDVCELGPRPLVVTGWLRNWLTGHFATAANLEDQDTDGPVQRMLWKADKTTGIVIESITSWKPQHTENRPAIIIKRNGWKKVRAGMDDRLQGTTPGDGYSRFENMWQGSHTLLCITNDGAETELLACELFRELNQFSEAIRSTLNLTRFEVLEVSELSLLEEAHQNYVAAVSVAYVYNETWRVKQELPKLKKIDLAMFQP